MKKPLCSKVMGILLVNLLFSGCTSNSPSLNELGPMAIAVEDTRPQPVVATSHSGDILSSAYTVDGFHLVTGGDDGDIIVWDVKTGRVIRRFIGHRAAVTSLDVSVDGALLVSGSKDETLRVWNLHTGQELTRIRPKLPGWVEGLSQIFEPKKSTKEIYSAVLSPDGETIFTGTSLGLVRIAWKTGKQFNDFNPVGMRPFLPSIKVIAWDESGRYVITNNYVWDVTTGKQVYHVERQKNETALAARVVGHQYLLLLVRPDGRMRIVDLVNGKELSRFLGHKGSIIAAAISHDGRNIVTSGEDKTTLFWHVSKRTNIGKLNHQSVAHSISMSLDSRQVAFGFYRYALTANLDSSEIEYLYSKAGFRSYVTTVSPDGHLIANGNISGEIRVWKSRSGTQKPHLLGHENSITALAFSSNGKLLLSASMDGVVRVWKVADGSVVMTVKNITSWVNSVGFNETGTKLYASSIEGLFVFEAKTGRMVQNFDSSIFGGSVKLVSFGRGTTSKYVLGVFRTSDGGVAIWDTETGKMHDKLGGILSGHIAEITALDISHDGKRALTGSKDGTLRVWNIEKAKTLLKIRAGSPVIDAMYDGKSKHIHALLENGSLVTWDSKRGGVVKNKKPLSGSILSIHNIPDSDHILADWNDGSQRFLTGDTLEEVVSYSMGEEGGWLAYNRDGLFDSTRDGLELLNWRFKENNGTGSTVLPIEVFFREFFYPNLLTETLSEGKPKSPKVISSEIDRRQPLLSITAPGIDINTPIKSRHVKLEISIREIPADKKNKKGSGAKDLRVLRNGSLVKVIRGELSGSGSNKTIKISIPIIAGDNDIVAYAFNHNNIKSEDASVLVKGADDLKRKGKAYVLAVGVNQYSNESYNLNYAVADAKAIAENLKLSLGKLGTYSEVVPVTLLDRQATKLNIITALEILSGKKTRVPSSAPRQLHKLKESQPEDAVIVYFAGHGTSGRGKKNRDRYYLLPHDLKHLSDQDLEVAFERIGSENFMLIIDACQSGQALEAEEKRRGPMNSRGLAQLAYEKGMYILAAAQSQQAAMELSELGHGLLTYTLVERGLKNREADMDKNGRLTAQEWLDYATQQLAQVTESANARYRAVRGQMVDGGEETVTDQTPKAYYRRELDTPWVLLKQ